MKITVRLLEHDRSIDTETSTITRGVSCPITVAENHSSIPNSIFQVTRVVKHPRYSQTNYDNDIALIQLDQPVKFEGILNPVCMPDPGKSFTGDDVNANLSRALWWEMILLCVAGDSDGVGNAKRRVSDFTAYRQISRKLKMKFQRRRLQHSSGSDGSNHFESGVQGDRIFGEENYWQHALRWLRGGHERQVSFT